MSNWCSNRLLVTGPDAERFRERAKGPAHVPYAAPASNAETDQDETVLSFHALVPVPGPVLARPYSETGGLDILSAFRIPGAPEVPVEDMHGYAAEVALWGCKWGASHASVAATDRGYVYEFDTPWGPPYAFVKAVARAFPALTFVLASLENGCGHREILVCHGEGHVRVDPPRRTVDEGAFDDEDDYHDALSAAESEFMVRGELEVFACPALVFEALHNAGLPTPAPLSPAL